MNCIGADKVVSSFLIKSNYRYTYLIIEAFKENNVKRIQSFIKMGVLIPVKE